MNECKLLLDFRSFHLLPKLSFWLLGTGGYGRQNERVGSWMEVEWQVCKCNVSTWKMIFLSLPAVTSICVIISLHPLFYTSTTFTYFHVLPYLPMCFWYLHLKYDFTESSIYVRRKLPFTLRSSDIRRTPCNLPSSTSSVPFQKASNTFLAAFGFTETSVFVCNTFHSLPSDDFLSFDKIWLFAVRASRSRPSEG